MAPVDSEDITEQIKQVIHNLYSLITQSHDYYGASSARAMSLEVKELVRNLVILARTSETQSIAVPPEVIDYVENGRNPDIYTREFVEIVQRDNQELHGLSEAYRQFRDILAEDIVNVLPEFKAEVDAIVKATNG